METLTYVTQADQVTKYATSCLGTEEIQGAHIGGEHIGSPLQNEDGMLMG